MDFIFSNQVASFEAIIVLLCVGLIAMIFLYDGYLFVSRVLGILTPRKEYIKEKIAEVEKKEDIPVIEAIRLTEFEESVAISEGAPQEEEIQLELDREIEASEPSIPDTIEEVTGAKVLESRDGEESVVIVPEEAGEVVQLWAKDESISREIPQYIPDDLLIQQVEEEMTENLPAKEVWEPKEESPTIESLILKSEQDIQVQKDLWREEVPKKRSLPQISPENRDKLVNIANTVRTLIARGHIVEARALIIEGLSISKIHRELNIILGELYERDHAFEKAEFIYKDIAYVYEDDVEILMHLAASLAMQRKYRVSYEFYRKILTLNGDTEELLYTLAHLASELGETDETYEYARNYNNQYPKNPEILWLLTQSLIARGWRREAIEILIKLKNLTPYNQEIVDLIQKLVVEEEMAGNFWGEK